METVARPVDAIVPIASDRKNPSLSDAFERLDALLTLAGSLTVSRVNELYLHSGVCMILADAARQNRDAHEYARWIARAALVGDRQAQAELVRLLNTGTGIAPDKQIAAFWQSNGQQNTHTIRVKI